MRHRDLKMLNFSGASWGEAGDVWPHPGGHEETQRPGACFAYSHILTGLFCILIHTHTQTGLFCRWKIWRSSLELELTLSMRCRRRTGGSRWKEQTKKEIRENLKFHFSGGGDERELREEETEHGERAALMEDESAEQVGADAYTLYWCWYWCWCWCWCWC